MLPFSPNFPFCPTFFFSVIFFYDHTRKSFHMSPLFNATGTSLGDNDDGEKDDDDDDEMAKNNEEICGGDPRL